METLMITTGILLLIAIGGMYAYSRRDQYRESIDRAKARLKKQLSD